MRPTDERPFATDPAGSGNAEPKADPGFPKSFLLTLFAGCRLALMLPVKRDSFRITTDQVVLLLLCSLGLQIVLQFLETPPIREFSIFGLTRETAFYGVVAFAAYCVVGIQRSSSSLAVYLGMVLSAFPLIIAAWAVARAVVPPAAWMFTGYFALLGLGIAWPTLVAFRAARLLNGAKWHRAGLLAGGFAVIVFVPATLMPQFPIWTSLGPPDEAGDGGSSTAYRSLDVEDTYYRQARLLDGAYKSLRQHRPGIPDLYFVGFGGYARQDVFLREVRSVQALFDQRFDTAGRSAVLVNNPATIEDTPLASGNNLQRILSEVARRMDVEEDILFLFLTSHGSEDHRLSADFWPLRLNDLTAEALADYLDQAGIKWRVIVVSACYSGGFIDSLADENSLIITAARRDRRSFGCSHENEWTYFGQAFFDEQLRMEYSFTAAFDGAVAAIAAREQAEDLTPSEPQIHIGTAIGDRLEALRTRIEAEGMAASTN